ncbi:hypothetical protein ACS0TY_024170 [Phlomoides rotata]
MERAISMELVEGATVGKDKVNISHLQYADDTIFICSGKSENVMVIKRILRWFEMISGLKVNFDKSALWGINNDQGIMEKLGADIGYEVGKPHFSYLGWWRDMVNNYSKVWEVGAGPEIRRVVGNGRDTEFWSEWWVGFESLKDMFNRLFRISAQQTAMISDMGGWRNGVQDIWSWTGSPNGQFLVNEAYSELAAAIRDETDADNHTTFQLLGKSVAPRRFQAIGWKILK